MSKNAVTLADITSASWSLMLDATAGGAPGAGIGKVVQGLDDISQCVGIILTTMPGEDPFRPTFGCDLTQYVDKPIQIAQPAIVGTVFRAIEQWEPRIKVLAVIAGAGQAAAGKISVSVRWEIDPGAVAAPGAARIGLPSSRTTTVTVR